MRILLAFIFILFSTISWAQTIKIKILDRADGTAIQYATICYKANNNYCVISDSAGFASCKYYPEDSLIVTRVGYEECRISGENLSNLNTITLIKNVALLSEIVLSKNDIDDLELAGSAKKKNGSISLISNLELGRNFETGKSISKLHSVVLYFKPIENATHLFSLTVYSFDKEKNVPIEKISEQLFRIIVGETHSNKFTIKVNDSPQLPTNFFVSIKYLAAETENSRIELLTTNRWKKVNSFERFFSQTWVTWPNNFFLKNTVANQPTNVMLQVALSN